MNIMNTKKTTSLLRFCLLWVFCLSVAVNEGTAQVNGLSFGSAFNMLNSGNKNGTSSGQAMNVVSQQGGNYKKKVSVSYGIPISILFEYTAVKNNLSSDIAGDQSIYNNSPANVQQAFDNLIYNDFVKISDYNKVNVKLNFRFNPPKLVEYGSIEEDYLNNTQSSPYDAKIYKMPGTPVSASKIMVIQK